jgi:hypothetical protein
MIYDAGTFSWGLALLSKRLHTLHEMRSKEWPVAFDATDLHIHEYVLPKYLTYWSSTADRTTKMLDSQACVGMEVEPFGLAKAT